MHCIGVFWMSHREMASCTRKLENQKTMDFGRCEETIAATEGSLLAREDMELRWAWCSLYS